MRNPITWLLNETRLISLVRMNCTHPCVPKLNKISKVQTCKLQITLTCWGSVSQKEAWKCVSTKRSIKPAITYCLLVYWFVNKIHHFYNKLSWQVINNNQSQVFSGKLISGSALQKFEMFVRIGSYLKTLCHFTLRIQDGFSMQVERKRRRVSVKNTLPGRARWALICGCLNFFIWPNQKCPRCFP